MRPHEATLSSRLAATAIGAIIKCLAGTLRYDFTRVRPAVESLAGQPFIIAIWHNRLALSLPLYQRLVAKPYPSHHMAALVSASRDGAMLAEILKQFKVQPVRGSSSRRGAQALKELVHWAQEGLDLAITPDGPRGPCYTIQDGVIAAAQLSRLPILPVSYALSSKWVTQSWDRFQIPKPFSKCTVHVGQPIQIPRELTDAQRLEFKARLQNAMEAITQD